MTIQRTGGWKYSMVHTLSERVTFCMPSEDVECVHKVSHLGEQRGFPLILDTRKQNQNFLSPLQAEPVM